MLVYITNYMKGNCRVKKKNPRDGEITSREHTLNQSSLAVLEMLEE